MDAQLAAGIIRKSKSEWSSPIRVVDKPGGGVRICVDYGQINKIIKGDNYPLPSVEDLYNKLAQADLFTKIDMKAAYHQIPVEESTIAILAFLCEFGLYEYLSMPMGIKTAPAWFQRFIEETLRMYIDRGVLRVYLDNTIIFTNTIKYGILMHESTVLEIIQTLKESFLKISMDKSVPIATNLPILGHLISKNKIEPNPERAQCLLNQKKPENVKELQSWLGVTSYYRKFIDNYAEIAKPFMILWYLKMYRRSLGRKMEQ